MRWWLVAFLGCAGCAETVQSAPNSRYRPIDLDDPNSLVGETHEAPVRVAPPEFDDGDPSAIRIFHDVLAPYGTWRDDPRLGLVWSPSEDGFGDQSFVPYATHGRFTYRSFESTDEYVWVSDLPWGWVAFHYGRWTFTADQGWTWVPGRKYAGAWVDWRMPEQGPRAAKIVGWGPTPPSILWRVIPTTSRAIEIRDATFATTPYIAFATPYVYAKSRDLFATDLAKHLLDSSGALAVAHGTNASVAPNPARLGVKDPPSPPMMDRGLQQAWLLATPASAMAVGAGPELGAPPRLRTWVAGGPRWATLSTRGH